jgi:hypothetical protein
MPTNTLDASLDAISSITQKYFIPVLADNVNTSNPTIMKVRKENVSGGTDIRQPVRYRRGVQQNYAGTEVLDTSYIEKKFAFIFNWKQKNFPITISGLDEIKNNGPEAVLSHLKTEMTAAEEDALDSFATGIYSAGTDPKDLTGVRVFLSTSNTYGGIAQASNSWAQAKIDSTTTTLSLNALQTMYEQAKEGNDAPDFIAMTAAQFNTFWGLIQVQQRFSDDDTAKAGFKNLMFNGAVVTEDSYVPSGVPVIGFNMKRLCLKSSTTRKFPGKFIDFDGPVDQDAKVAHIRWAGELVCEQPRKFFAFTALV